MWNFQTCGEQCIELVTHWMHQNILQLIKDKTDISVFGAREAGLKVSTYLCSVSIKTENLYSLWFMIYIFATNTLTTKQDLKDSGSKSTLKNLFISLFLVG